MSPALSGTRGLFSVLQAALQHTEKHRIRLSHQIQDLARDFLALANLVHDRPTRLPELVPTAPSNIGASDACRLGMGGVWFDALDDTAPPIVWHSRFPPHVSEALVTSDNPTGSIAISNLELTGIIAHQDVLATSCDVRERTIWTASDNRATVAWATKGSATLLAGQLHLLRLNALHQRAYCYVARQHYIPGPVNAMADDASRRWDLNDAELLTHFTTHFPQTSCWQIRTLPPATHALLIGALSKKANVQLSCLCSTTHHRRHLLAPLFAQCYRTGSIAPGRHNVRSRTLEEALRAVGQAHSRLGAPDPRPAKLPRESRIPPRITLAAWKKADAPPRRVKPLPLPVVAQVWALAQGEALALASASCLIIGFFFLLRPGEYLGTPVRRDAHMFRLRNVQFWIGSRALDHLTCPAADLRAATFATLTFTQQKNGVRNERIGHGRSGHPSLCPVTALASRVLTLRAQGATADTTINAVRSTPSTSPFRHVTPTDITTRIQLVLHLHPDPAYALDDVSVPRSTRAGGAMALLCASVDSDRLRMIGRWRSDEMFRYLHLQAQPIMNGLAAAMLWGGDFRLSTPA